MSFTIWDYLHTDLRTLPKILLTHWSNRKVSLAASENGIAKQCQMTKDAIDDALCRFIGNNKIRFSDDALNLIASHISTKQATLTKRVLYKIAKETVLKLGADQILDKVNKTISSKSRVENDHQLIVKKIQAETDRVLLKTHLLESDNSHQVGVAIAISSVEKIELSRSPYYNLKSEAVHLAVRHSLFDAFLDRIKSDLAKKAIIQIEPVKHAWVNDDDISLSGLSSRHSSSWDPVQITDFVEEVTSF